MLLLGEDDGGVVAHEGVEEVEVKLTVLDDGDHSDAGSINRLLEF